MKKRLIDRIQAAKTRLTDWFQKVKPTWQTHPNELVLYEGIGNKNRETLIRLPRNIQSLSIYSPLFLAGHASYSFAHEKDKMDIFKFPVIIQNQDLFISLDDVIPYSGYKYKLVATIKQPPFYIPLFKHGLVFVKDYQYLLEVIK